MSGAALNTSTLAQELASLNEQIEQVQGILAGLENEMRAVDAELETFSAERLRFDALRDACNALARLDELAAGQLFWGELPEVQNVPGHIERVRGRIADFDAQISGFIEKHAKIKVQIQQRYEELEYLHDDIRNAHARDERIKDAFVVDREISPVPYHPLVMPWSHDSEGERRYRRALLIALFLSMLISIVAHVVELPPPPRPVVAQVPERLAKLVRKELTKPKPVKPKEEKKPEKKLAEKQKETPKQDQIKATPAERVAARTKAESSGVMAFKDSFKDLMDETPIPKLGVEANLNDSTQAAGAAQASRSMVAMAAGSGSGSGGISNAAVSRNLGSGTGGGGGNGIGRAGTGFSRVKSDIAGLAGQEAKALSSGTGPSRTDEEIQILFDRYKAALYRIYNKELRKDPTLRGKMVLRITIEPSGAVSACKVESSNINSAELAAQVVERVKKINFGAKEGVPKTTILYPIDFLPAG